jgi:preprotein translocase subunit YajC
MVNETKQSKKENEMKKGDKVKTIYGKTETVMKAGESIVITYESYRRNEWYHPTKVWKR